jgi:hypothetical protein
MQCLLVKRRLRRRTEFLKQPEEGEGCVDHLWDEQDEFAGQSIQTRLHIFTTETVKLY